MGSALHFDIDMEAFRQDPYPTLAEMRKHAPIAYVPQLGGTLLTRHDDIVTSERQIDIFSSHQPGGLMNKLMGHNLMRRDGEDHLRERRAIFPALSPKAVGAHWQACFQAEADRLLDDLAPRGAADLVNDFAMPLSAAALKAVTGLTNMRFRDMDAWSQAMIDGIANYIGNPEVEARCHEATAGIDRAIDEMVPVIERTPDRSLLGVMHRAGMPMESIRANIKLAISGGQNEPRDAIAGAIWALLDHPDQRDMVPAARESWTAVFADSPRGLPPIGMSPRRIAKPHRLNDIDLEPEEKIFLMFSSANRDEGCFDDPDVFDVTRDTSKSIAFGAGPHFCAGAWVSRSLVAKVALPCLFERLKGLRLADGAEIKIGGWAFRGLLNLPVVWDTS